MDNVIIAILVGIFIGLTVRFIYDLGKSFYLKSKEPEIKITSHQFGDKIEWKTIFKGTYKNLKGKNIYVIHLPLKKAGDNDDISLKYYNQNMPRKNNGKWECSATVGYPEGETDINRQFEIYTVITEETEPTNSEIKGLPKHNACHKITVTRK